MHGTVKPVAKDKRRLELEDRLGRLLAHQAQCRAKGEQARRGWYDGKGVRQGGLMAFVRHYWDIIEPDRELIDGWPLWAMVEHLEAVTFGEITRLLINVPPGFMKSLLVDVFWPAWEWGPCGRAHYRYVTFSYSATLTERDNERFRSLVSCERYQRMWGPFRVKVEGEGGDGVTLANKTVLKVKNTKTGWKFASSVGGVGTGERGDRIVVDDPHNVKEAESDTIRSEVVRWFRESVSSRFNSLETGALVIIMQRVHDGDVAGTILELGLDYCHLMIPWEYDSSYQVEADGSPVRTTIGWSDPRYCESNPGLSDGKAAWPERFPIMAMARTRAEVGPYAWSSQYQQAPAPRGGGIFERAWWQLWEAPDGKFPVLDYIVASLDGAYTSKEENDPCALTIWGIFSQASFKDGKVDERTGTMWQVPGRKRRQVMLVHAWRKHLKFSGVRVDRLANESPAAYKHRTMDGWGLMEWVMDTCNRFKVDKLLIEAKASGISAAQELQNRYGLQNWAVHLCPVKGDKVARALSVQPIFSQLQVYAPDRDWAEMVMDEMAVFPKHRYDDLTDSATQALKYLRESGLLQTDAEVHASLVENVTHRGRLEPLYPV